MLEEKMIGLIHKKKKEIWNKGKKCPQISRSAKEAWMNPNNKYHSKEYREKLRKKAEERRCKKCGRYIGKEHVCKIYFHSEETKEKISEANKGREFSEAHRRKLSETKKRLFKEGKLVPPLKGKKCPAISEKIRGKNSPFWKGDDVGYTGIHLWIRKWKPKQAFCTVCKKVCNCELHNISGEYKRDFDDWMWVCKKCHKGVHKKCKKLKEKKRKRFPKLRKNRKKKEKK